MKSFFNQLRVRPRLITAIALGFAVLFCLPSHWPMPRRALIAWDVGAVLYLVTAWTLMFRAKAAEVARRARAQDDGAVVILALTVFAAIASLAAIVLELIGVEDLSRSEQVPRLVLVGVTIVCSWLVVNTAFALHYAHAYYMHRSRTEKHCLDFPGDELPSYVDFLYFAFVLGTTSQTSDVAIKTSGIRRVVLLHGIIAFFFNTMLLALAVNIAAGLI